MDSFFGKVAYQLSEGAITGDHLKLVVALLSSYLFAYMYRYLPTTTTTTTSIKHLYSITIALFTTLFFLKLYMGFLHITVTCLSTYFFMKYNHSQQAPWMNFILVILSMSLCHLMRQWKGNAGDATLDYSGMMMIVTIKLTMFGFNIDDGRRSRHHLKKHPRQQQLTAYNQQMKIDTFPTLISFMGWMFFFGGFLVGPACEYMDYLRFVMMTDNMHRHGRPSSLRPTCLLLVKSALTIAILVSCSTKYHWAMMLQPEWQRISFVKKLVFIQVTAFVARCKYYTVWLLSEGACVLCGFGFTGYDAYGQAQWDRVTNIHIVHCEIPQSLKEMSDAWNMGANRWLKHYVYLRVTPSDKKPGVQSTLVTYGVSALWHGFYPGYYIMFLSLGLYQTIGRMARKMIRPWTLTPDGQKVRKIWKTMYDVVGMLATMFIINTMSMAFLGLYMGPVFHIWRSIYFIHYVLGAFVWVGLKFAYAPCLATIHKRQQEAAALTTTTLTSSLKTTTPGVVTAADMDVTDLGGVEPPLPEEIMMIPNNKKTI